MIAYSDFITAFPEFANAAIYPQAQFDLWKDQGYRQLSARRFRDSLDLAVMLFAAHNLVLYARDRAASNTENAFGVGGAVGQAKGPVNSKTVKDVTTSYSPDLQASEGAGIYNSTVYGQRLWKMMEQFCLGPVYAPGRPKFFSRGPYRYRGVW